MKTRFHLGTPRRLAPATRLELVEPHACPRKVVRPFAGDPFMVSSPTRAETAVAVSARVGRLIEFVRAGRIYEAIEEFYAADVELGRGALAPMFGLETRAGRRWLRAKADAQWRTFRVRGFGVNGDTSFIECSLGLASADGERFTMDQVAVAQWRDGKIVKECLLPTR